MYKIVKSRKAKKITTLLAVLLVMTSLIGSPMKAHATEVGDVLYEETEDNYVQEDITEEDEEYYYPSDTTTPGGSTTEDENKNEETKEEETKEEETKQEETKQDSVADSLEDLDKDQFIDADTPIGDDSTVGEELDKSETEGETIPEDVKDEVDVKFPTDPEPTDPEPTDPEPTDPEPTDPEPTDPEPTDPEPTDPEPTDPEPTDPEQPDVPKMGDDYTRYYVGGAVSAAVLGLLASIKNQLQKHKEAMAVLGTDTTASKVVASKKKFAKKGKKKLM